MVRAWHGRVRAWSLVKEIYYNKSSLMAAKVDRVHRLSYFKPTSCVGDITRFKTMVSIYLAVPSSTLLPQFGEMV